MIALAADADRTWMGDAACRTGYDPNLWHPNAGAPNPVVLHVCATCPVKEQCENYANANREQHGVWGGLTTDQRNRRARAKAREAVQ